MNDRSIAHSDSARITVNSLEAQVPKLLFLGRWDWANSCNKIARAINAVSGVATARVATENAHSFGYQEDLILTRDGLDAIRPLATEADWIVTTGDGEYEFFLNLIRQLPVRRHVKFGVTHAGSAYRSNSRRMNRQDAELGAKVRFIGSDSMHLARGDPRAVPHIGVCRLGPMNSDAVGRPIVSHSPSSRATKGTEKILPVLERLQAEGLCEVELIEGVSADEAFRRRSRAHIHVDQMHSGIGGFGQSATEAMGVGCAVLCDINKIHADVWRFYPRPPIIDVRKAAELDDWLRLLIGNPDLLQRYRESAHAWAAVNASELAITRYWLFHLARCTTLC
jgi:hypothetical protein